MKVALCLSGYLRTFKITYQSLQKHLLSKYDVDIFIHTWNKLDYSNPGEVLVGEVKELYHPTKLVVEKQFDLPVAKIMRDKNPEVLRNINNVLSMFYKIKKCNELKCEHEVGFKYDYVIRFRPDIKLKSNVELVGEMNIPKYGDFGGLNDQFAFGISEKMDYYCSLYDKIEEYLINDKDNQLCMKPELFIKHHLTEINLNRPDIDYDLLKKPNEILNNEQREKAFGYII